ncbi:MAG: hypothetical protein M1823_006387, partial [Watsoniomyces obsoletus]
RGLSSSNQAFSSRSAASKGLAHSAEVPRRRLRGELFRNKVTTVADLQQELDLDWLAEGMARHWRENSHTRTRFIATVSETLCFPVEVFQQLEVPLPVFQKADEWTLHPIRSTGGRQFRNQQSREDWAWIRTGDESNYGILAGHLPGRIKALFKVRVPGWADAERLVA